MSFTESCDNFDTVNWGYEWNPPVALAGEWVFQLPASTLINIYAARKVQLGYGNYKLRFRTSGARNPGTNYLIFLYNETPHNELALNMIGNYGGNQIAVGVNRSGVSRDWTITSPIAWEDGAYHVLEFNYTANLLEVKLDGITVFTQNENPSAPFLPLPNMTLIIGANGNGTNNPFTFYVDEMDYTAQTEPPSTYILSVATLPVIGVPITIDGISYPSPFSAQVTTGPHSIAAPTSVTVGTSIYNFTTWSDGSTSPSRTMTISGNLSLTAVYLAPAAGSFFETCDTFDPSKWGIEYNAPIVAGGEWAFIFPVGVAKNIHAVSKAQLGYGNYKIKLRTSGPRVPGVNYYVFLYNESTNNELDIPEIYGDHPTNELSISTIRGSISDYWFFSSPINWEDGAIHTIEFNYFPGNITMLIDGTVVFNRNEDPTAPVYALPPMNLIIGGSGKGTNTQAWTLYITEINYTTEFQPPTPISPLSRVLPILAPILIGGVSLSISRRG